MFGPINKMSSPWTKWSQNSGYAIIWMFASVEVSSLSLNMTKWVQRCKIR